MSSIKAVYANGCSMIFGQELVPPGTVFPPNVSSEVFYQTPEINKYRLANCSTGRLAQKLGAEEYVNDAISGSGNFSIQFRTFNSLRQLCKKHNPSEILVVIGFTDCMRQDFGKNDGYIHKFIFNFNKYSGEDDKAIHDVLTKYFTNPTYLYRKSLVHIESLKLYLDSLGVKSILFNSIPLIYDSTVRKINVPLSLSAEDIELEARLRQNFFLRETNMHHHLIDAGVEFGQFGHPLVEGQEMFANMLYEEAKCRFSLDT